MKMMVMICVISFGHHNYMNNFLALFFKKQSLFYLGPRKLVNKCQG